MCGLKLCVLLCVMLTVVHCYNILVLMNVPSHSHHKWMSVYVEALAKRGHHVTFVSVDEYKKPVENVTGHYIEGAYALYGEMDFIEISKLNPYKSYLALLDWYAQTTRDQASSQGLQRFIDVSRNKKYDLVVFDSAGSSFILGLVDVLGRPPVVGITAFGVPPWVMDISATPYPIANSPNFIYPLGKNLTFINRLENSAFYIFSWITYELNLMPVQEELARKCFGTYGIRSIAEIQSDMNINMVNLNWGSDNAFPLPPNVIPIGGLHITAPKPLPNDIKEFLDLAKDGAIFFSFGSNVQCSQLNKQIIAELTLAFRAIAPIRVLWKWEEDTIADKPDNVKIGKWLPQNDILAHPNIRLFITHGGMLSTQEALHHGVPIIGIPFFLDQFTNLKRAEGYAEIIELEHLKADLLVSKIKNILQNRKYKETALKLSKIFRDDLNSPLERALFWTEYAIRHNGAAHLKPPSHRLSWFQSSLFDIILVYLALLSAALYLMHKVAQLFVRIMFGSGNKQPKSKRS